MEERTTLVLGASEKPERYANMAVRSLRRHGHPVVAVGLREGRIDDVPIVKELPADRAIGTVTLYLGAQNQAVWEDRVLALRPERIIFNPGAENPAFAARAREAGIRTEEACTLVLLSTGQY